MAEVYLDADRYTLRRLAELIELVARGDTRVTVLAEIRMLEDRFGLNPVSRRRLQWEVAQAAPGTSSSPDDEERWLRVVSD